MNQENDDVKDITNAIAASAERICAAITSGVGVLILAFGTGEIVPYVGAILVFAGVIRATFTANWAGFTSQPRG